jgi:hypothetical protein
MRVRAVVFEAAVEHHVAGELPAEELSLPMDFLDACEGRRDDPVTLELQSRNRVLVSWTDGGVPQQAQYEAKSSSKALPFPNLPEQFAEISADVWPALGHARETTDRESTRFSLTHIQLRGGTKQQIVTTDGRQVLFQSGFQFPWTDDVLIPAPAILGWPELAQNQTIAIGRTADHVALRLGHWTILLRIDKEGRFPTVDGVLPDAESIKSRLLLRDSDAEFLARVLPRLPCDDDYNKAVTIDLNGQIAIRAKPQEGRATEVVLSGSRLAGQPLLLNSNRAFLARALKLGFREIGIRDAAAPLVCRDDLRQYGWMPLGHDGAIQASDDMIRIASPVPGTEAIPIPKTTKRSRSPMSDNPNIPKAESAPSEVPAVAQSAAAATGATVPANAPSIAAAPAAATAAAPGKRQSQRNTGRKPSRQGTSSPIEQAVALKQSLRETLIQTSELIRTLKRQKKQSRMITSTLKSLKELQKAG